ncbi:MAG: AAA family ATPase, partial [Nocardioidaceae bacterium]
LLECMEERQVTVDNSTYYLEDPFMVIATQNPIEMEGTYPLPEAQRDRFMARVSMGYPVERAELAMLDSHAGRDPLEDLEPVTNAAEVAKMVSLASDVFVSQGVQRYVIALVTATRQSGELRLGASPRAALHLVRAAKASAALDRREYVIPDDIQRLVLPVLGHRVLMTPDAAMGGRRNDDVLRSILEHVRVPETGREPAARDISP